MSFRKIASLGLAAAITLSVTSTTAFAQVPSFLKMFKRSGVEAKAGVSYELTEEDGPWLILASTLVGSGSRDRADRLALEIRRDLKLPAFIYREKFDFTGNPLSGGAKVSGGSRGRRMAYANEYEYEAYAVLVGEYDSINHPQVQADLERVKTAVLDVFRDPKVVAAEMNQSSPVTAVKAVRKWVEMKARKPKGPMGNAFITRNPLLPEDYFRDPAVDSFISKMNDGLQFSLLECDGKFSVIVRTFTGYGTIVYGKTEERFRESQGRMNKCAADAEKMVVSLRKDGIEAYQFHDRDKSVVTVGSFDSLGRELPGGGFEYAADIRRVMQRFSALNVDPGLANQVAASKGYAANNAGMIPFDVQPVPIAVPKKTKRSLYSATFQR